jgi:hypothetical protein
MKSLKYGFKRDWKFFIIIIGIGIISFRFLIFSVLNENIYFFIIAFVLLMIIYIFAYLSQSDLERKRIGVGPNIFNSSVSRSYDL